MIVTPKMASMQYSSAENCRENFPNGGERNNSANAPTTPPIMEATVQTPTASMPRPCWVSLYPSIAVAAEAGVPGVWHSVAVIEPP